jgi:GTP-binding protein
VTNANVKIGAYPFTTLHPHLGVVRLFEGAELVLADIPGIIKDAHVGKGLGDRFLAHIERCQSIIHIVDISAEEPLQNYLTAREELRMYSSRMAEKREVIVFNKIDLVEKKHVEQMEFAFRELTNNKIFAVSTFNKDACLQAMRQVQTA